MPADGPARLRPGRVEPRDIAELRSLKTRHPELSAAVDMQVDLAELHRRVHTRLRTPLPHRQDSEVAGRISRGERLIDFDDLLIEWSDFRLVFRQTADILHRAGVIEPYDQAALQELARSGNRIEPLARDYYGRTARPDRYVPPPESEPGMIDEVLGLAMKPFLARCAEVWGPRVPLKEWRRGWCPLCGLQPDFATIVDSDLLLICGRCTVQWPYDIDRCAFCSEDGVRSFSSADGRYRVIGCNHCKKYLKAYDAQGAPRPVLPSVDTIATLPLDAAAIQKGYDG